MSLSRILLAGLVGGIAMFVWGAIFHAVLPIGEMGMQNLPAETTLVPQFKQAINQRGFYRFPGMDMKDKSDAAEKAWDEKAKKGPLGILIYDPEGMKSMAALMSTELVSNIFAALLLAVVLSGLRAGKFAGAIVGTGMGLFAWLSISVSYWNWYRVPSDYIMGEMIEQGVTGLLAGIAITLVLGRPKPRPGM